jgi:hypothetical protein
MPIIATKPECNIDPNIAQIVISCWYVVLQYIVIICNPIYTVGIIVTLAVIFGSFYYNHLQDMKNSPTGMENCAA